MRFSPNSELVAASRASSETSEEAHAVAWKMAHVGTCVGLLLDSWGGLEGGRCIGVALCMRYEHVREKDKRGGRRVSERVDLGGADEMS